MELLSVEEEAELRRSAYIAVLRGELGAFESHERFASRIGRARIYLEQLLKDEGGRAPGPRIAHEIVEALPLDPERRRDLLDQMLLAGERRVMARRLEVGAARTTPLDNQIETIRKMHWAASYAGDANIARTQYRGLLATGERFLNQPGIERRPLIAVETCLVLHDVLSVLNRPAQGLMYAMTAGRVLRRLDPGEYRKERERVHHFRVNAPVAEASSLTALGLAKQAEHRLLRSEAAMQESETAAAFWAPHIAGSKLAALSERNRFSLYVAEALAKQVKEICDRRAGLLDPQFSLQADIALARAYLRYDTSASRRKAQRLLRGPIERLDEITELGTVKRTIALRTYADACLAVGRRDECAHFLREAWRMATDAGLEHQLASMKRQHSAALMELGFMV